MSFAAAPLRSGGIQAVSLRSALWFGFAVRRQKVGLFCCQKGRTTKQPHLPPPKKRFSEWRGQRKEQHGNIEIRHHQPDRPAPVSDNESLSFYPDFGST